MKTSSPAPGIIVRNPDPAFIAGLVATKPIRGVLPNPVTLYVDGRTNNLGTTIASGFDFLGSYEFEAGAAGKFELGLSATYFDTYEVAITPAADRVDQLNNIYNPLRFKARASATWSKGGSLAGAVPQPSGFLYEQSRESDRGRRI